jgi:hypothetical protein
MARKDPPTDPTEIQPSIEEAIQDLVRRGLVVDSGQRRWSDSLGQRWDTCQLGQQRDVPIDNRKDQRFEGIAASSRKFGTVGTLDRVRGPVGFILAWAVVGASHGKVGSCRPPANLLEPLASTPARSIRVMVLRAVPQYARRIARAFRWHRWGNALAC